MYRTGETGKIISFKIVQKDGSTRFVESRLSPLRNEKGEIIGFRRVGRDVTEHSKDEEASRTSEERYRILVENANEAIVVAQDGMLKFANPKTVELSGYSIKELIHMPFVDILHPDDRAAVLARSVQYLIIGSVTFFTLGYSVAVPPFELSVPGHHRLSR